MADVIRVTLNYRLIVILAVAVTALGAGVHVLHGRQVSKQAGILKEQADAAEKNQEVAKAIGYLRKYLAFRRNDQDARERLGFLLAGTARNGNETLNAYLTLDEVLRSHPDRHRVRRKCVTLALSLGPTLVPETLNHLKVLSPVFPADAELDVYFAECYTLQVNYTKADEYLREAIRKKPDLYDAHLRLASTLRRHLNRVNDADKVIEDLLAMPGSKTDFRPWVRAAAYWNEAGEQINRDKALNQARDLAPKELEVQVAVADWMLQRSAELSVWPDPFGIFYTRVLGKAVTILRQATAQHAPAAGGGGAAAVALMTDEERLRRVRVGDLFALLTSAEAQAGDLEAAEAVARRGTESFPELGHVLLALIDVQIRRNKLDEAEKNLTRLKSAGYPVGPVAYHQARVLTGRGDWVGAARLLRETLATPEVLRSSVFAAHFLAGQCYTMLGEYDRRAEHFRAATGIHPRDPLWLESMTRLAATLQEMGRTRDAIDVYERLATRFAGASLPLARLLIESADGRPADAPDWQRAEQALRQCPPSVETEILRADLALARGDPKAARTILVKAIEAHPTEPRPVLALAVVEHQDGQSARAAELIAEARVKKADPVELRLVEARTLPTPLTPDGRSRLSRLADGLDGVPKHDQARLFRRLAERAATGGAPDLAVQLQDRLIAHAPTDQTALFARFDTALEANDEATATRLLERVAALDGSEGSSARVARAILQIRRAERGDQSGLQSAEDLLQSVRRERPWWGRAPLGLAMIADLKGDYGTAVVRYAEAIEAGERQPKVVRRLLTLFLQQGRERDAIALFLSVPESAWVRPGDELLVADLAARSGNPARAAAMALRAVPEDSTDPKKLLIRAALQRNASAPSAEVERILRRATAVGGDRPETWIALVDFLAADRRRPEAEAATADAAKRLSGPARTLGLAQCETVLGNFEKAKELFAAVERENPNDPPTLRAVVDFSLRTNAPEQARRLCERLLKLTTTSEDDRQYAIGVLTIILGGQADEASRRRVLEILGILDRPTGNVTTQQLRNRALGYAVQIDPKLRREAVAVLEAVEARQPLTAADGFLLAQVDATTGNWPRARGRLAKLVAAHPETLLFPAYLTAGLLQYEGNVAEAKKYLAILEKQQPNSPRTVELVARVLDAEGNSAAAAERILRHAAEHPAWAASVLEKLGLGEQAAPVYRRLVDPAKPETTLAWAGYLGRMGKTRDAMQEIGAVAARSTPPLVAATGVLVLYTSTSRPDPEDVRVVEGWIGAIDPAGVPPGTVLELTALLRVSQGNYQLAIELLRQLVRIRPNDADQFNNLAHLLAVEKQFDEAAAVLGRAKALAGLRNTYRDTEAVILVEKGEAVAAVELLMGVVQELPEGVSYFHLARARRAAGDHAGSLAAIRQAKRLKVRPHDLIPQERAILAEFLKEVP